jgi:hypothetical protein
VMKEKSSPAAREAEGVPMSTVTMTLTATAMRPADKDR